MTERWTHSLCDECWRKNEGKREPNRIAKTTKEKCCMCGQPTESGIYIRRAPWEITCQGDHKKSYER